MKIKLRSLSHAAATRAHTERARYYEARAGEYYRAGMQNQGDRALGMANFYWVAADKPAMRRAYPGTSFIAMRGRTRSQVSSKENPISSTSESYSSSENPIEGAGFKVGERVQVHPGHDRFMMGDRYGKITSISNVAGSADPVRIRVKLDRSGQSVWFRPDYLMHINPISTRNVLIGVGVVGGLGLLYAMMSAPKPITPGVPTVITPQVIPPLTSTDDGASQSAHVGDTIQITLPAPTASTIWVASSDTTGVLQLASSAAVQQTVLAQGGTLQYTVVGVGNDPVTFTLTNTSTGAAVSTLSWTIVASAGQVS